MKERTKVTRTTIAVFSPTPAIDERRNFVETMPPKKSNKAQDDFKPRGIMELPPELRDDAPKKPAGVDASPVVSPRPSPRWGAELPPVLDLMGNMSLTEEAAVIGGVGGEGGASPPPAVSTEEADAVAAMLAADVPPSAALVAMDSAARGTAMADALARLLADGLDGEATALGVRCHAAASVLTWQGACVHAGNMFTTLAAPPHTHARARTHTHTHTFATLYRRRKQRGGGGGLRRVRQGIRRDFAVEVWRDCGAQCGACRPRKPRPLHRGLARRAGTHVQVGLIWPTFGAKGCMSMAALGISVSY